MNKIRDYQEELIRLSEKIKINPNIKDVKRIEQLFKISGISDHNIYNIYKNCGFDSWEEYVFAKKANDLNRLSKINCVDDKIEIVTANILHVTSSLSST